MKDHKIQEMEVPFDENGNMLDYEDSWCKQKRKNSVHKDKLTLTGYSRGRSSAKFNFTNKNGKKREMFLIDVSEMLMATTIVNGVISGKFCYVKRGKNYGIKWLE